MSAAPYLGIPGIEVWPIVPGRGALHLVVARGPAPAASDQVAHAWGRMCGQNPRLYDGPVLSVVTFDPDRNELTCRRDSYQRLAVQPSIATGVRQLSVTGVLTARDASGRRWVLLGRRGESTRIFPGMWEIGPSGGLPPPALNVESLGEVDLLRHLSDEVVEEVGLDVTSGRVAALVRDHGAHSDDVVIECDLGSFEQACDLAQPANWEYSETMWLPVDSVGPFDTANEGSIISATRALFRTLGSIDPF